MVEKKGLESQACELERRLSELETRLSEIISNKNKDKVLKHISDLSDE